MSSVSVELLADNAHLVREAGHDELPVTLVAIDEAGSALGVVGLDVEDDALTDNERARRTPWLVGLWCARTPGVAGSAERWYMPSKTSLDHAGTARSGS